MTDSLHAHFGSVDALIEEGAFSGVVSVSRGGHVVYTRAAGFADRAHAVSNTLGTRFAIASGTKGLTALAVMSLVADGEIDLDSTVRGLLGDAGEVVDPVVTARQLLAHTSGVGDYFDESKISDIEDYVLDVPVHRLACPADYLAVLRGHAPQFPPGQRFAYSNSGYVLLALLIEALTGRSYYDIVHERVCAPAGLQDTGFLRLDELPGNAAIGYLCQRQRQNHLHLPVRGAGDGGAYSTAADIARLWDALHAGRIVPLPLLADMTRPSHPRVSPARSYGLGFWLPEARGALQLEGSDAGISFFSRFEPARGLLFSVFSNTTRGAWPVAKALVKSFEA